MASPRARPNKSERESAQDDAERTADRLHSAAIHLLRRLRREDAQSGLSAPRLSALSVLVFGGPLTLGELANAEQVRPPTMTRLVTALEADGLVTREPDASDGRLTRVYLEGALERALRPLRVVEPLRTHEEPTFDGPAPDLEVVDEIAVPRAVLDPFEVYVQGEQVLRQELSALSIDHLRAIVDAYGLGGGVAATSPVPAVLIEYIVAAVRSRFVPPARDVIVDGRSLLPEP